MVPVQSSVDSDDRKLMAARIDGRLAPAAYRVMWRVVAADGHPVKGSYEFTVR